MTEPSHNNNNNELGEDDVRAMVRILADTVLIADAAVQRAFVMSEIGKLVGADSWVWGVSPRLEPGKQPVYLFEQTQGFDDQRIGKFLQAVDHPDSGAMTAPLAATMVRTGSRVTRDLSRIVSPARFQTSPARPLWEAAGIGTLLISIGPVPGVGTSVAGFYRNLGEADFTPRETRIMHIILTELPWLHQADLPHLPARGMVALTPRQRQVLNQLMQGHSRKAIATAFQLSENTIHGYVKGIFRQFGVRSQVELIARLTRGDGGDC